MGIRLETVLPRKRFLWCFASWRFLISAIFAAICIMHFKSSTPETPLIWLIYAWIWVSSCLLFLFAGMALLCYLQRPIDFCENGISCENFELFLADLERVKWRQERFRLLGIIPIGAMRESLILFYRTGPRQKKQHLRISGFYYHNLRTIFDEAYQHAFPWELVVYKRKLKRKRRPVSPLIPVQKSFGPMVPPSAQWQSPQKNDDKSG